MGDSGNSSDSDFSLIDDDGPLPTHMEEDPLSDNSVESAEPTTQTMQPVSSTPLASSVPDLTMPFPPELIQLNSALDANPYQYQLHVDRIQLLEQLGLTDQLEVAFQSMHNVLGMSEDLWDRWINHRLVDYQANWNPQHILDLYWAAVTDYLSIPLWINFVQFAVQAHRDRILPGTKLQAILSAAVRHTRCHYTQGYAVFNAVRESHTAALKTATGEVQQAAVLQILNELYLQYVATPSSNLDTIFADYSTFVTSHFQGESYESMMVSANKPFANAKTRCRRREPFEAQISQGPADPLVYRRYIFALRKDSSPDVVNEIATLYERILVTHFSSPDLWQSYINHAATTGDSAVLVQLCARAIRNCPWSGSLWASYLRALEASKADEARVATVFNQSLAYHRIAPNIDELVVILQERLAGAYRAYQQVPPLDKQASLRAIYSDGQKVLNDFCQSFDPYARLDRAMAHIELEVFHHPEGGFRIWQSVVDRCPTSASLWLSYLEASARHDSHETTRKRYQQALLQTLDWPEQVFDSLLEFERLHGTLSSYQNALDRVCQLRVANQMRAQKVVEQTHQVQVSQESRQERKRQKDRDNKKKRRERARQIRLDEGTGTKRKYPPDSLSDAADSDDSSDDEGADGPNHAPGANPADDLTTITSEGPLGSPPSAKKRREACHGQSTLPSKDPAESLPPGATPMKDILAHAHESRIVLVGNLSPALRESDIRDWLKDCGPIKHVNLVRDLEGTLKGYGYVEFIAADAAQQSVDTKQNQSLDGRPITIRLDAAHDRDNNTVYVCNFPASMTQDELQTLFAPAGDIKQVRIPATRPGKARCFAYIEYMTPQEAQRAVEMLNGRQLEMVNRTLSVAISDPQRRNRPERPVVPKRHDPRVLFVGNVAPAATSDELRQLFEPYGTLRDVRLPVGYQGDQFKGYCFVEFEKATAAQQAIQAVDQYQFHGLPLSVGVADPEHTGNGSLVGQPKPAVPQPTEAPTDRIVDSPTVRMTNFAKPIVIGDIRDLFSQFGEVKRVHVNKGGSKVFIDFQTVEEASKAIAQLNDTFVKGRRVKVHPTAPPHPNPEPSKPKTMNPSGPAIPASSAVTPLTAPSFGLSVNWEIGWLFVNS
ncbi:Splicing factor, partial [Dimargaris cristalligena]